MFLILLMAELNVLEAGRCNCCPSFKIVETVNFLYEIIAVSESKLEHI